MTLFNYGVQVVAIIALMNYYEKWCYQEFKVEEDSSGEILIVESHSGVIEYRRLGSATILVARSSYQLKPSLFDDLGKRLNNQLSFCRIVSFTFKLSKK